MWVKYLLEFLIQQKINSAYGIGYFKVVSTCTLLSASKPMTAFWFVFRQKHPENNHSPECNNVSLLLIDIFKQRGKNYKGMYYFFPVDYKS